MNEIEISGARKHNLKNISLKIPRQQLIVITGVSGSGKSSLAIDTIHAMSQKKYLGCLTRRGRLYLKNYFRPEVSDISGISPTIAIHQRHVSRYASAQAGDISGIGPYLRLLMTHCGKAHCPSCGKTLRKLEKDELLGQINDQYDGLRISIFSLVVHHQRGGLEEWAEKYIRRGFLKTWVDGQVYYLESMPGFPRQTCHDMAILVDTITVNRENEKRLRDAISLAAWESDGEIMIGAGDRARFFSEKLYCFACHVSVAEPRPADFSSQNPAGACETCQGTGVSPGGGPCPHCRQTGHRRESLSFTLGGKNIFELGEMPAGELAAFLSAIHWTSDETHFWSLLKNPIIQRLQTLSRLNLDYLSLNRRGDSLSGGEYQRSRLTAQIGFRLSGIMYVLDEPSIGLHPSEQTRLLEILQELKQYKNTVLVVEHDEQTIRAADFIVELGPGSGERGGEIVFSGAQEAFSTAERSITRDYLSGAKKIGTAPDVQKTKITFSRGDFLQFPPVSVHNVRKAKLRLPLRSFTAVTGVSGSGKSSLVLNGIYPLLFRATRAGARGRSAAENEIRGPINLVKRVMMIDQGTIGRSPRSCVATYLGLIPWLARSLAALPEARWRGYSAGYFNFNHRDGRCPACLGLGEIKTQLDYLPDLVKTCPICGGGRYRQESLSVKLKELTIADLLNQTASEVLRLFERIPWIARKLSSLERVGLGYLRLGQNTRDISGGEAQRLKLARELGKATAEHTIFIFDEPTVGLHFADLATLLDALRRLLDQGHTVIVIEHQLDLVAAADYIVDMGPGGGLQGGKILYQGPLPGILSCKQSKTAPFLAPKIKTGKLKSLKCQSHIIPPRV